jgi:anthranilate phosphoribosyltransferase
VILFFFWQLIESLIIKVDLSESEAEASLDYLLDDASEAVIIAFLVLLRAKGETFEELSLVHLLLLQVGKYIPCVSPLKGRDLM